MFRPLQKYVSKFYKQWMRIIKLVWCEFSMKYSTDWFPIFYLHSNIYIYTTQTTKKKHWTHCNGLKAVFHYVGENVCYDLLEFLHHFNIFSHCIRMTVFMLSSFFRMEPCYLLMVNQDPVLFSLTQRMKFFRAVLVVIKIELTKLFYAIISVVYYQ